MNEISIREQIENCEDRYLSEFAVRSKDCHDSRDVWEEPCDMRTEFQRDRDRILHCKSFRRLKHKTQVFLAPAGDHYRTRLTHTLEVSQIARSISKALFLNEDLTEAIALGHDLGHTPFGHAGERALDGVRDGLHFSHCEHSIRIVELLEKDGQGLNLTKEVRDGILNHRSSGMPATLEGKVVRLSDKIAYINHDIDDAIRAGILTESDIPLKLSKTLGNSTKERLNTLIHDVVINSTGKNAIEMSADIKMAMNELRQFLFENVYSNPIAKGEETKAIEMVKQLFNYYMEHDELLPKDAYIRAAARKEPKEYAVCDYIAAMSDQYSVEKYKELFIPNFWNF